MEFPNLLAGREIPTMMHAHARSHAVRRSTLAVVGIAVCLVLLSLIGNTPAARAAGFSVGFDSNNLALGAPSQQEQLLNDMNAVGAKVVRADLLWYQVAAGCGKVSNTTRAYDRSACYNWSTYDSLVAKARAHHINVMLSISGVPKWAIGSSSPYYVGASNKQYARVVEQAKLFANAAAARYRAGSKHGFVEYWTVWNEPNSHTFWLPFNKRTAPQRYAYMVTKVAHQILKRNPTAHVAAGPTGPHSTGLKPLLYIKAMQPYLRRYGTRRWIDAWAHNPYTYNNGSPRRNTFAPPSVGLGNMQDLYDTLDADRSTRGLRVWATEFAWNTRPPDSRGISANMQASFLSVAFDRLWSSKRVPIAIWYVMQDPPKGTNDWHSGIVSSNGVPKRAFVMLPRMLSISTTWANPGQKIRVWGKDSRAPRTAYLVWSTNGHHWTKVPHQKVKASGVRIVIAPIRHRKVWFALRDGGKGRGPAQLVHMR